jgi:hypothetical protein
MHPVDYYLAQSHLACLHHPGPSVTGWPAPPRPARPRPGGATRAARGSARTPREGPAMPPRDITRSLPARERLGIPSERLMDAAWSARAGREGAQK